MPDDLRVLNSDEMMAVIELTPLVSIDLVIVNAQNEVLLGMRVNEPARSFWFVPGGRICKNETLSVAFQRISKTELGFPLKISQGRLMGAYDHIYESNRFGKSGLTTHYVALGYLVRIDRDLKPVQDQQHDSFEWRKMDDVVKDDRVHANTRIYVQELLKT